MLNKTLVLEKSLNVLAKWQNFQWKEYIQYHICGSLNIPVFWSLCELLSKQTLCVRRENCKLLENYHKTQEQGGSWEEKCHEAETGFS